MSRAYSDIAFTPAVRAQQERMGSRANYARLDGAVERNDALTEREAAFIEARDGFYQATVSETGWPYVQFRGGPAGFLKVLDAKTIGYADFRGNVQYISVGNLGGDDRVSIILMDYANQARLKLLGRARLVDAADDPELIERLRMPGYRAQVERAVVITVEGFDWNCPQHITPKFTEEQITLATAPLRRQLEQAQAAHAKARAGGGADESPTELGDGSLALTIAGVRALTPRIRAYQLRAADGSGLPPLGAGAHIDLPVRLPGQQHATRRYSVMSRTDDPGTWEIAVQREPNGRGGSAALHADYRLGTLLNAARPGNDFEPDLARPALLIAGGIGITPIRAMAHALVRAGQRVALHYAVRSRRDAAFVEEMETLLGARASVHAGDEGQRLAAAALLRTLPADTLIYVCGPARLIEAVLAAAAAAGIDAARVRFERFAPPASAAGDRPVALTLARSSRTVAVSAGQSLLDAIQAAGIEAPSACRTGTCGTCAVKVLAGTPEHRDSVLSDAERKQAGLMCPCVSRAQGEALTLDL